MVGPKLGKSAQARDRLYAPSIQQHSAQLSGTMRACLSLIVFFALFCIRSVLAGSSGVPLPYQVDETNAERVVDARQWLLDAERDTLEWWARLTGNSTDGASAVRHNVQEVSRRGVPGTSKTCSLVDVSGCGITRLLERIPTKHFYIYFRMAQGPCGPGNCASSRPVNLRILENWSTVL
jgi:hypothetical protein